MKNRFWIFGASLAAAMLLTGPVRAEDAPKAKVAKKAMATKMDVVWPAEAIKWADGPAPGTHMAHLWGDMKKGGPFGVLFKFDAGVMHPMHWHTRDLKIVVISGTFLHHPDGGTETKLGPGSYLLQSGGKRHISGAGADAPCEFFMTSPGAFDMMMVDAAKPAKKASKK